MDKVVTEICNETILIMPILEKYKNGKSSIDRAAGILLKFRIFASLSPAHV